jgi:hypothetical protein
MRVKPAEGRAVRDPQQHYRLMPPEGGNVPDNTFWQRRLRDGDVVMIEDDKAAPEGPTQGRPEREPPKLPAREA